MKEQVERLKEAMANIPQLQIDTHHLCSGGMYARTGFIPAGTVITGCTHKTDHFSILAGDASLTIDDHVERVTGYNVLPTKKGMTRAIYAHSDCWMTTICKTDKTDLTDIEDDLVEDAHTLQTRNPELSQNKLVLIEEAVCS
jgi:hypothetical protein